MTYDARPTPYRAVTSPHHGMAARQASTVIRNPSKSNLVLHLTFRDASSRLPHLIMASMLPVSKLQLVCKRTCPALKLTSSLVTRRAISTASRRPLCDLHVKPSKSSVPNVEAIRTFTSSAKWQLHTKEMNEEQLASLKVDQKRLMEDLHHTCQWGTGERWGEYV